jgi:hypothetical protein
MLLLMSVFVCMYVLPQLPKSHSSAASLALWGGKRLNFMEKRVDKHLYQMHSNASAKSELRVRRQRRQAYLMGCRFDFVPHAHACTHKRMLVNTHQQAHTTAPYTRNACTHSYLRNTFETLVKFGTHIRLDV